MSNFETPQQKPIPSQEMPQRTEAQASIQEETKDEERFKAIKNLVNKEDATSFRAGINALCIFLEDIDLEDIDRIKTYDERAEILSQQAASLLYEQLPRLKALATPEKFSETHAYLQQQLAFFALEMRKNALVALRFLARTSNSLLTQ